MTQWRYSNRSNILWYENFRKQCFEISQSSCDDRAAYFTILDVYMFMEEINGPSFPPYVYLSIHQNMVLVVACHGIVT